MVRAKAALPGAIAVTDHPGVATYWRESAEPFTAALAFRVGRADETLLSGGITHAVEHLAMSAVSRRRLEANAFVDSLRTVFFATGDQARVLRFLTGICEALATLPTVRLDAELGVLQAEAAGGGPGVDGILRGFRFGATGHGLEGYEDIGYSHLDATGIQAWAKSRFTAQNAVLWMTAAPASGFELVLADGTHQPPPPAEPPQFTLPAVLRQSSDTVAITGIAPRGAALAAAARILRDRLHESLRTERGRSYEIVSEYEPLTAVEAHWFAAASGQREHAREVTAAFLATVGKLADVGPTADELHDEVSEAAAFLCGKSDATGLMSFLADAHLLSGQPADLAGLKHEADNLEAAEVAAALQTALATALLLTPSAADPPAGFSTFPLFSDHVVGGTAFAHNTEKKAQLVVGDQGIMATHDGTNHATIAWAVCEAVLRWPNGDREAIGRDGVRVHVCSGEWKNGFDAIEVFDRHAPTTRLVEMRPEAFPTAGWMVEHDDGGEIFVAPSWEHDGWALVDLTRHGGQDDLPRLAPERELALLAVGDFATVLVTTRGADGRSCAPESLTVMVVSVSHQYYGATVEHASKLVPALSENAGIAFAPHHVAATRKRKIAGAAWRRVQRRHGA